MLCQGQFYGDGVILLTALLSNTLSKLGIVAWMPRNTSHMQVQLRCMALVISDTTLKPTEQKILDGMLSVLKLEQDQIQVVHARDMQEATQQVNLCRAASVLQLSMDHNIVAGQGKIVRTFSPQFLAENIQHKAQAYKDLLTLRDFLHGTS